MVHYDSAGDLENVGLEYRGKKMPRWVLTPPKVEPTELGISSVAADPMAKESRELHTHAWV